MPKVTADTLLALVAGVAIGGWLVPVLKAHLAGGADEDDKDDDKQRSSAGRFSMVDHLSLVSKSKRSAPLRGLLPLNTIEGMCKMAGGIPPASTFPIAAYTMELVDGATIRIDDPVLVGKAQQYMHDVTPGLGTIGYVPLLAWIKAHVTQQHAPPYEGWECCVCTGNCDGFQKAWEAVLDPGDTMLVDELNFAFSTSQLSQWTGGRGLYVEPVTLGERGINPEALAELLDNWTILRPGRRFPKALFTIPAFHNPTCGSLNTATASAVYAIACKHDLIIIEDDPYRYLGFGDAMADEETPVPGLDPALLPASYLSVDTDARVIRCDTFSKWISPGLRCGWLTAPAQVIQKIGQGTGPSLGVASSVQVMLMALFEHWGKAGLEQHISKVQRMYRARCGTLCRAAEQYLAPTKLARWAVPEGGMFIWIELLGVEDTEEMLPLMKECKIAVVPGSYFSYATNNHPASKVKTGFVRAAFCSAPDDMLVEGMKRLALVLSKQSTAGS